MYNIHIEYLNGNNHFDQLCINYANEKIQQFFVERMLRDEQKWYKDDKLDIPDIPYFDNIEILSMNAVNN